MINLEDVRRVQWGFTHNYNIAFPNVIDESSPLRKSFLEWIPAIDVDFPLYSVETKNLTLGSDNISIPVAQAERDITITFLDNEEAEIENWLEYWVKKTIFNSNDEAYGVSPLSESCKLVIIERLTSMKELVKPYSYLIYPIQGLPIKFTDKQEAKLIQQTFRISAELTDIIKII